MTSPHDNINRRLRDRPGRVTALPAPAGTPIPVTDDAAQRKEALARLNAAIRDGARRTPWPGTGADGPEEAA